MAVHLGRTRFPSDNDVTRIESSFAWFYCGLILPYINTNRVCRFNCIHMQFLLQFVVHMRHHMFELQLHAHLYQTCTWSLSLSRNTWCTWQCHIPDLCPLWTYSGSLVYWTNWNELLQLPAEMYIRIPLNKHFKLSHVHLSLLFSLYDICTVIE